MNGAPILGVIGGSGFYHLEGMKVLEEKVIETPFGSPSSPFIIGELEGKRLAFIARHGNEHRFSPTNLPYQANIYGMKSLGVKRIVSFSAVGSLQEQYRPGDFVFVDQFFDRTKHRKDTFFDKNIVAHIGFADPICSSLRDKLMKTAEKLDLAYHDGGAYVCMEGPAFSTLSESNFYRKNGFSVIGMTNLTEAKLAREAEICYATVAMITDYDCWKEEDEAVSVEMVLKTLKENTRHAKRLLTCFIKDELPMAEKCSCHSALENSIMTPFIEGYDESIERLGLIINKYKK